MVALIDDNDWSPCYKKVMCKYCKRVYICLPDDDYYESSCETDGMCEKCLLLYNSIDEIIEID